MKKHFPSRGETVQSPKFIAKAIQMNVASAELAQRMLNFGRERIGFLEENDEARQALSTRELISLVKMIHDIEKDLRIYTEGCYLMPVPPEVSAAEPKAALSAKLPELNDSPNSHAVKASSSKATQPPRPSMPKPETSKATSASACASSVIFSAGKPANNRDTSLLLGNKQKPNFVESHLAKSFCFEEFKYD
jgi:hypothetical protein